MLSFREEGGSRSCGARSCGASFEILTVCVDIKTQRQGALSLGRFYQILLFFPNFLIMFAFTTPSKGFNPSCSDDPAVTMQTGDKRNTTRKAQIFWGLTALILALFCLVWFRHSADHDTVIVSSVRPYLNLTRTGWVLAVICVSTTYS